MGALEIRERASSNTHSIILRTTAHACISSDRELSMGALEIRERASSKPEQWKLIAFWMLTLLA